MEELDLTHCAGLPLIARPPLSADDLEFLHRYIESRRAKVKSARNYAFTILVLLLLSFWLLRSSNASPLLLGSANLILSMGLFFSTRFSFSCLRHRRLVEMDIKAGYLLQFQGEASAETQGFVAAGLLSKNQRNLLLEVLPVSGKIHRINQSLLWPWAAIDTW